MKPIAQVVAQKKKTKPPKSTNKRTPAKKVSTRREYQHPKFKNDGKNDDEEDDDDDEDDDEEEDPDLALFNNKNLTRKKSSLSPNMVSKGTPKPNNSSQLSSTAKKTAFDLHPVSSNMPSTPSQSLVGSIKMMPMKEVEQSIHGTPANFKFEEIKLPGTSTISNRLSENTPQVSVQKLTRENLAQLEGIDANKSNLKRERKEKD